MSNQSTFYVEGVKVAMDMLELVKKAQPISAGRMLLSGIGRGAVHGAATGAAAGGVAGATGAPEGEGGRGFLRGMGYGALTGSLVGGAAGGLKTRAFQQKNPHYVENVNRGVQRANTRAADIAEGPLSRQEQAVPLQGYEQRMKRLQTGALAGGAGGLAAGGLAGLSTPKRSIVDQVPEELGV